VHAYRSSKVNQAQLLPNISAPFAAIVLFSFPASLAGSVEQENPPQRHEDTKKNTRRHKEKQRNTRNLVFEQTALDSPSAVLFVFLCEDYPVKTYNFEKKFNHE
jgi:hypothetical protein